MDPVKLSITLQKSDGKKNSDMLGGCLIAKAVRRTLTKKGVEFDDVICGLTGVTVINGKKEIYSKISDDIQELIIAYIGEIDKSKDYNPPKKTFELNFTTSNCFVK